MCVITESRRYDIGFVPGVYLLIICMECTYVRKMYHLVLSVITNVTVKYEANFQLWKCYKS